MGHRGLTPMARECGADLRTTPLNISKDLFSLTGPPDWGVMESAPSKEGTMASDQEILRDARKIIAELSHLVETYRSRVDAASVRLQAAIARMRTFCPLATIVEVEMALMLRQAIVACP